MIFRLKIPCIQRTQCTAKATQIVSSVTSNIFQYVLSLWSLKAVATECPVQSLGEEMQGARHYKSHNKVYVGIDWYWINTASYIYLYLLFIFSSISLLKKLRVSLSHRLRHNLENSKIMVMKESLFFAHKIILILKYLISSAIF